MLIGELASETGVSARTLRFYEADGLLPEPARTAGGYRDYDPDIVERVRFIRQAQAAGLTLSEIREILAVRDGGEPPCDHVAQFVASRLEQVTERIEELERTRQQLLALRDRLTELDPAECGDGRICVAISAG